MPAAARPSVEPHLSVRSLVSGAPSVVVAAGPDGAWPTRASGGLVSGVLLLRPSLLVRLDDGLTLEAAGLAVGVAQGGSIAEALGSPGRLGVFGGAGFGWGPQEQAGLLPLQATVHEDETRLLAGRVDRLALSATLGAFDLVAGRQALTWGAGRFFAPTDLVAPFSPRQLDRESKPGVDALRLAWSTDPTTQLTVLAAAPGDGAGDGVGDAAGDIPEPGDAWVVAGQGLTQLGPLTVTVVAAARHLQASAGPGQPAPADEPTAAVFGGSLQTDLAGFGVRLEGSWTSRRPEDDDGFYQAVLSADYQLADGPYLLAEGYWNGAGLTDDEPAALLAAARAPGYLAGWYASLRRPQAVLHAAWPLGDWTPALTVLLGPADSSALVAPRLGWVVNDWLDLTVGAYLSRGAGLRFSEPSGTGLFARPLLLGLGSEYGAWPATGYLLARAGW